MSRVITFSRTFPAYHPKAGQPTFFVEQILNTILPRNEHFGVDLCQIPGHLKHLLNDFVMIDGSPKWHTIRAGHRWKVGDKFSPRIWSGKPYNSKMITIAPDIIIAKIWNIGLRVRGDFKEFYCDDCDLTMTSLERLAENDGLSLEDFLFWFTKPFEGQIICWKANLDY